LIGKRVPSGCRADLDRLTESIVGTIEVVSEFRLIARRKNKSVPQRLKPRLSDGCHGTTEVVPSRAFRGFPRFEARAVVEPLAWAGERARRYTITCGELKHARVKNLCRERQIKSKNMVGAAGGS
jgi:hypothetical protein